MIAFVFLAAWIGYAVVETIRYHKGYSEGEKMLRPLSTILWLISGVIIIYMLFIQK